MSIALKGVKVQPDDTYQEEVLQAVHYGVDGQHRFPVLSEQVQYSDSWRRVLADTLYSDKPLLADTL